MKEPKHSGLALMALGALGVVYGDIGTSPLYAINEIFFGHSGTLINKINVLGSISLVFWALTLVVSIKYVLIVLRATTDSEGGVFTLYSLISNISKIKKVFPIILIFSAGLLYGEGIITPAISVLSAVEGLGIITESFQPFIIPITIIILTILFSIQKFGTAKVGFFFGPIMVIWFFAIGYFGLVSLLNNPEILAVINPIHALRFIQTHELYTVLITLGSVVLVMTGSEAMYADMGHFGLLPIRISWYLITYPALILNYLGQGAYLLSQKNILDENIFYSIVPHNLLAPMVILATLATVIASQALISGAFSLTTQAISLRLLPYLPVKHTHKHHRGQIYIPSVNWMIYFGSISLVLSFGTSTRLAGAYGLAASGVMFVTTISMIIIATRIWNWKPLYTYLLFIPFALLDGTFLFANSLKIFQGGYIPLMIGFGIFAVIQIWKWGRLNTVKAFNSYKAMKIKQLVKIQQNTPNDLDRTMVFLTRMQIENTEDQIPIQLDLYWKRVQRLPEHLVFLNIKLLSEPHAKDRVVVKDFTQDNSANGTVTSLTVQFGFMEEPYIEPLVNYFIKHKDIPSEHEPEKWIFKIIHEKVLGKPNMGIVDNIKFAIYHFIHQNTQKADEYFGLGHKHHLTIDVFPVHLK